MNLKTGSKTKHLFNHMNAVITVKKIFHPKYGECLISQSNGHEPIKIWVNKKFL